MAFALEKRRALRGVFSSAVLDVVAKLSMRAFSSLALCAMASVASGAPPQNFLYTSSDDLQRLAALLERPDIGGVQIVYSWKSLERAPGEYDFSQIERDLAYLDRLHKRLFLQIQDRFFEISHRNVPAYLLEDPVYRGGLAPQTDNPGENQPEGHGWVAMQWNANVRARFQALLTALGRKFDGRVLGINLPETAADLDQKAQSKRSGFSCDAYFAAELENLAVARKAFAHSHVVQYANFWPCEWNDDRKYMSRFFSFAAANDIGAGGPDIVPWKNAQMKNSYPFFNKYKGKLRLVAMAVQEPTLTYTNPKTQQPFTRAEFVDFAENYLGVNIIFWSTSTPWLQQPR
jgi:hypothetical protein